ncbi:hypothetical protein K438DRAFT_701920 [Mycena galopus ATCC 62051]|nr:hypothetical protein K438DRAFT_701920 [Mycena galopus ATCC 62051]
MSVEEIQALIAKLSADIHLQKEVLQQLERAKSLAQRQLNAIRDPVARLPLEISSEIFVQCLPPHHLKPAAHTVPLLLLNVCNTWTDIALSTPALWTAIHLTFPQVQTLELWFRRAHNHPLSVSLQGSLDYNIASTLGRFSQQLKYLEIQGTTGFRGLVELPCLEKLVIRVEPDDRGYYRAFSLAETMVLVRLAPNLVECIFHVRCFNHDTMDMVVLPHLRFLSWGDSDIRDMNGDDGVLKCLSLPALDTLCLSFIHLSTANFSAFLRRSSPPLRTLLLGAECSYFSFVSLAECLRLVPSLTHLELHVGEQMSFMGDLVSALADSTSSFLPNLSTLKIEHDCSSIEFLGQELLRALSARRVQLLCAHLRNPESHLRPGPDVCSGLRELAESGMDVWVGTEDCNFILS